MAGARNAAQACYLSVRLRHLARSVARLSSVLATFLADARTRCFQKNSGLPDSGNETSFAGSSHTDMSSLAAITQQQTSALASVIAERNAIMAMRSKSIEQRRPRNGDQQREDDEAASRRKNRPSTAMARGGGDDDEEETRGGKSQPNKRRDSAAAAAGDDERRGTAPSDISH